MWYANYVCVISTSTHWKIVMGRRKGISNDARRRWALSAVRREDSPVRRVFRIVAFKAGQPVVVECDVDTHSRLNWWLAVKVIGSLFASLSPTPSQSTHNAIAALEKVWREAEQRGWFCGCVPTVVTRQWYVLCRDNSTTMRADPSSPHPVVNSHTAELVGTISWYLERREGVLESNRQFHRFASVFRCPGMLQPGHFTRNINGHLYIMDKSESCEITEQGKIHTIKT